MKKFAALLGTIAIGFGILPGTGVAQDHRVRVAFNAPEHADRTPARPPADSRINTSDYVNAHLMIIGQYRSEEAAASAAASKRNDG